MRSRDDVDDGEETTVVVDPPLWKCYWTKMQLMMLLSGLFMLVGSLLHLSCPMILILIINYIESQHTVGSAAGNVTLPKVRLILFLVLVVISQLRMILKLLLSLRWCWQVSAHHASSS